MKAGPRSRLAELAMAAALVVAAIVWIERTAWRQIASLRAALEQPQLAQIEFIDRLKLDALELRLALKEDLGNRTPALVARLDDDLSRLRAWLQETNPVTLPATQRALMSRIESALTNYARELRSPSSSAAPSPSLKALLDLCDRLDQAADLEKHKVRSARNASLNALQRVLFFSLALVALAGAVVVAVFYRRLIAPLRAQLSESRTHLERQEKLASLGVFAAGIAHEIRNPLTAIKVRLFSLRQNSQSDTSREEDMQVISDEISRLERIVGDFLQFARPSEPELQLLALDTLLQEVCALLRPQLAKKSVDLVLEAAPEASLHADPQKLKQVLINLVQNAGQSIDGPGTVTLRARLTTHALRGRPTGAVAVEVADTGKGMPPEVIQRLFDPFFTTKEDGTGLGLPIAARIIDKHGGIIEYETHVNRGTTFRVVLPRASTHEESSTSIAH